MADCIPEDDLLDLATGQRSLANAPLLEAHLADCAACSGLLCTLICAPREDRRDLVGRTLGPYRLEGLLGAGAMGEVYRAWDQRLERHVAVKALSARFADSPDRIRRLEAEARAAAAITHPNVVTVYDTGADDGVPFVVSELIRGETLRSMIDRGPIPRRLALDLGLQLARGVAAAHAQSVVHRDLKPGNLIVTGDGTLKILDFGLAKVSGDRDVEATEPGTLLGTSGYLSPEQARGEPADARSDIFAVGAILYELLGGRRAFGGATFAERLSGVLRDTPPALDDPADPIVQRCLEKDPKKRFQSAGDLAWVLQDDKPPRPAKRAVTLSRRSFVAGAAIAGAGGVLLGRFSAPSPRAPFVPEARQLTYRYGRVSRARFTHDGGSIIYSALWDDLPSKTYSTRIDGGGSRELDLPSGQLLAVSSHGQIALSIDHHFLGGFNQEGKLAIAPIEGGTPRLLGADVQDADFTPSGEQLAIIRRADGRFRLELPLGTVLFEAGWLAHARVSPDGKLVACCVHKAPDDDRGDLVVVPCQGGVARVVARDWSSIDGIAWAANGRAIWISASREGGNNSVRAIALDGREVAHVPSVGRVRVHDLSRGALAVTHTSGRLRMMAKAPGATEIDLGLADLSLAADIAADGSTVVFAEFGDVDTANGIYIRPTSGGAAQRLGAGLAFDLADDGRGVLGIRANLVVFPIDRGQPRDVPLGNLTHVRSARWCANGIVVAAAAPGRLLRLWRVEGAAQVPISDEGLAEPFVVGPDGKSIAMIANDRLYVFDALGGAPRSLDGAFANEIVCGWASTNEVFVRSLRAPIRVRKIDIATAASTETFTVTPPPFGFRGVKAFVVGERGDSYAYSSSQELSRLFSMIAPAL